MKSKMVVLIIMLVTCSFPVNAMNDIDDEDTKVAVRTLMEFGVINGYPDGSFKPEATMTRAEAAKIIVIISGLDVDENYDASFDDTEGHWANGYIFEAKEAGIINGVSETKFEPNSPITYDQFTKLLICSLGYQREAENLGGWPEGYIQVADRLLLTDGINFEKGVSANRGEIVNMIYNAMDVNLVYENENGDLIDSGVTLFGILEVMY